MRRRIRWSCYRCYSRSKPHSIPTRRTPTSPKCLVSACLKIVSVAYPLYVARCRWLQNSSPQELPDLHSQPWSTQAHCRPNPACRWSACRANVGHESVAAQGLPRPRCHLTTHSLLLNGGFALPRIVCLSFVLHHTFPCLQTHQCQTHQCPMHHPDA